MTFLCSDVHGNRGALEAFLRLAKGHPVICCGDILGLGGDNQSCVDLLMEHSCVAGNHEVDLLGYYHRDLAEPSLRWVAALDTEIGCGEVLVTHCYVDSTASGPWFRRISHAELAREFFEKKTCRVAFSGHDHAPGWWETSSWGPPRWHDVLEPMTLRLHQGVRYVIVVGSLGEGSWFAEWDGTFVSWRLLVV